MKKIVSLFSFIFSITFGFAQGLHFSQFYNAPMLLNPANTGLLKDNDWRAGINYRNQWATVPVSYSTFSAYADFGLFRSKWETSWLGTGVAVWRDVAGDGNLALTKVQTNLAYHVLASDKISFSAGMAMSYNQRSVDYSKLSFDVQWDEFSFNKNAPNLESNTKQKTTYVDMVAGANFSYYNNSNLYIKASFSAMHLNQPTETFYGAPNKIGLRPVANVEVIYLAGEKIILNPTFYYTRQKKASEMIAGSLFNIKAGESRSAKDANEIVLGAFYRVKDAIIGAAGYKWNSKQFMVSYDHTISDMAEGNGGLGAFEFSLIFEGSYHQQDFLRNTYGCPRF